MQIDSRIDPSWCEALLGMLEGDLNHNRIAEVKTMLRTGIDSLRKSRSDISGIAEVLHCLPDKIPDGSGGFVVKPKIGYHAYVIEAKKLMVNGRRPVYLTVIDPPWSPDIASALQFSRSIDAERYMDERNDGTWEIVEHGFCD